MIEPFQADGRLLADIAAAPEAALHAWWLGQSGFLLKWGGAHLLVDPYLSDSLTRKYAGTTREHVRLTRRCVAPEALGFVDLVLCSHLHTDHCDPATLVPLAGASARSGRRLRVLVPRAVLGHARDRLPSAGVDLLPTDAGQQDEFPPFRITAVAAAHPTVERDEHGACRFLGFLIGAGPWTVYHAGDTLRHDGLVEALRPARPDLALLPINGRDPARGVAGNLDGPEAAALARDIGAAVAIPCHYGMFAFNTAAPEPFAAACAARGQPYRLLRCGERWSSA